jgi:hypothetical protein
MILRRAEPFAQVVVSDHRELEDEARKHDTQYQRMIRRLLDAYADHYLRSLPSRAIRHARQGRGGQIARG